MTDAASKPDFWRRLAHTPMRDWIRGRITGRMDVSWPIDHSDLPDEAKALVREVVRRTRLWKTERVDVASELVAHFTDGLAAGHSVEELTRAFGDRCLAARLIRRAKKRNRPLVWKIWFRGMQAMGLLLAVYVLAGFLLYLDRPNPTVDYLAKLNAPAMAVPQADRAWPIYRQVMVAYDFYKLDLFDGPRMSYRQNRGVFPDDSKWPQAVAFLQEHPDLLTTIRTGTGKPGLGLVVGLGKDSWGADDRLAIFGPEDENFHLHVPQNHVEELISESMVGVHLAHLTPLSRVARLLAADITVAAQLDDTQRILDDVAAMLGLVRQLRRQPILVVDMVCLAVTNMLVERVGWALQEKPGLFSDTQLRQLAHSLAALNDWRTPDYTCEIWMIEDTLQRIYGGSDRVTLEGLVVLNAFMSGALDARYPAFKPPLMTVATPLLAVWIAPRDEMLAQQSRLWDTSDEDARRPLRQLYLGDSLAAEQLMQWQASFPLKVRYLPLAVLMPGMGRAVTVVRTGCFARQTLQVAIAAELYKRRHGAYPDTVEQLVPRYLPEAPIDESATAGNLLLKVTDEGPIVYGRGLDDDDDGGVPHPRYRANWPYLDGSESDGDWILYPPPKP